MKRALWLLMLLCCTGPAWATVPNVPYFVQYFCTGSVGPYPFTFGISDPSSLLVKIGGSVVSSANYTTTPVNNNYGNGGSLTFTVSYGPCPVDAVLTIERITPITQALKFYDNMPIPMVTFERGLDKLTEISQEIWGGSVHSIQMQNNGVDLLLPATGGKVVLNFANCTVTGTQNTSIPDSLSTFTITCPSGGGGGGSGTVNSGTLGYFAYYAADGTAVSSNSNLNDGVTLAATLTYGGSGGINSPGGYTSGDNAHTGAIMTCHSTGVAIDYCWTEGPSATFGASYTEHVPDAAPAGAGYHRSSQAPTGSVYPEAWVADGAVGTGTATHTVCWKTTTTLSYCEDQPDSSGVCTCH